jgi:PAS domain S-box-containing protein
MPASVTPSAAALGRIFSESPVACLYWDAAAADWMASPGLCRTLGMPAQWASWTDTVWSERLHSEETYDVITAFEDLKSGHKAALGAMRLRHQDGGWRWFRCENIVHPGSAMILLTDTTESQQLQAAVLDSQMRLRSLHDTAPVAIILWSKEGRITDWNRMAETLFGHTRQTVIGQKLAPLLIAPEDYAPFSASIKCAMGEQALGRVTCRTLTSAGKTITCEWDSVPLRSPKGGLVGIFSLVLDVTEKHAAEQALRRAKDSAEELSHAKTEFMATISHELRTPLNGVLGMAQLLDVMIEDPDQRDCVKAINDSGQMLLDIINAIVSYTEIDILRKEESTQAFLVEQLVELTAERYAVQAHRKGLEFAVSTAAGYALLGTELWGDQASIERVLANLLDNAVRFTESGRVSLTVDTLNVGERSATLSVVVADSGIGMSPEFVEQHLYTPFKQAENAVLRKNGGVGLGLALTKKLVDRLQGTLNLVTAPNQGSSFTLTLELHRSQPTPL